jgi:hypothetical protein
LTLGIPLALVVLAGRAAAQTTSIPEARHDTSNPLFSVPPAPDVQRRSRIERAEHRVKRLPRPPAGEQRAAPVGARQLSTTHCFQPTVLSGFAGISDGLNGFVVDSDSPDTTAAVGRTQALSG